MKILVVDDDLDLIELAVSFLRIHLEAEILIATDGEEALAIFKNYPDIDFIVTDMHLPNMNSIELIAKLRNLNFAGQEIVISSNLRGYKEELEALGVRHILVKPNFLNELVLKIDELSKNTVLKSEMVKYKTNQF